MYIFYILHIYIYVHIYKNLKPTPRGQWRDLEQSHTHKPATGQDKVSVPRVFAVTVQAWCKQCCLVCLTRPVWDSRSTQVVVWSDTPRGQVHRWWSPEARTDCRTQPPCPERKSVRGGGCGLHHTREAPSRPWVLPHMALWVSGSSRKLAAEMEGFCFGNSIHSRFPVYISNPLNPLWDLGLVTYKE